jgi:hypothetical protein
MEASFAGASFGTYMDINFNIEMYFQMGKNFCEAILDLCEQDQSEVGLLLY